MFKIKEDFKFLCKLELFKTSFWKKEKFEIDQIFAFYEFYQNCTLKILLLRL